MLEECRRAGRAGTTGARATTNPNPRKTLNRQDHPAQALGTRVAKIPRFGLRNRKTRRPLVERQRCPSGPFLQPISLGVLGALAVGNFGLGFTPGILLTGRDLPGIFARNEPKYLTANPAKAGQKTQREPGSEDPASDQGRKSSGLLRQGDSGTPGISGSFFACFAVKLRFSG